MKRYLSVMAIAACLVGMTGCNGSGGSGVKVVPAAGTIRYQGKPVANVDVVFYPEKGPAALGKTDSEGKFQLKTNGQLGASMGKNKVTVGSAATTEIPPSDGRAIEFAQKSSFNKKYSDQNTTDLVIDLPEAGNNALVLDLTD